METDATLAAGILYPGSTPGRFDKIGNKSRAESIERQGDWIPGSGPDVFMTGTRAFGKGSTSPATARSAEGDATFSKGSKSVDHTAATLAHPTVPKPEVDVSGLKKPAQAAAAAAAAAETIASYQVTATASLAAVDPIFAAAVARWNSNLGGVSSSPSIRRSSLPHRASAKGASLGSGTKYTQFADVGIDTA